MNASKYILVVVFLIFNGKLNALDNESKFYQVGKSGDKSKIEQIRSEINKSWPNGFYFNSMMQLINGISDRGLSEGINPAILMETLKDVFDKNDAEIEDISSFFKLQRFLMIVSENFLLSGKINDNQKMLESGGFSPLSR